MEGLGKAIESRDGEEEFSFKSYFVPLTTVKAITWIVVIGLIVWANILINSFVGDDIGYIVGTPVVHVINLPLLFGQNLYNSYGYYRPLSALYFAIVYSLFGSTPFFYHFLELLFHITNTILLYIFLKTFLKNKISFLLSLIFLVHPMQVESVSYIAQSDSTITFLFGIIALLLCRTETPSKRNLFITFSLLLLAMLSKESSIILFLILLAYRYFIKKGKLALYSLLSIVTVIFYALIRFSFVGSPVGKSELIPIAQLSLAGRLLNVPQIFLYYVRTFVYPIDLAIMQQWVVTGATWRDFYLPFIIALAVILTIVILGIRFYKTKKIFNEFVFFAIWFFCGIGIYLQVIPLDQTVSDRWFYLPMAGLLGIIGVVLYKFSFENAKMQKGISVILITIIVLFSIRTMVRNTDWQNEMKLDLHDEKVTNSYNLETHVALQYLTQNSWEDAIVHFKKSVAVFPTDLSVNLLGYAYERKGDNANAKYYYLKSLQTPSGFSGVAHQIPIYENVGRFFVYVDKNPEFAKKYIEEGIQADSTDMSLRMLLVQADLNSHDHAAALNDVQKAYEINPTDTINSIEGMIQNNQPVTIPIWTFYGTYSLPSS